MPYTFHKALPLFLHRNVYSSTERYIRDDRTARDNGIKNDVIFAFRSALGNERTSVASDSAIGNNDDDDAGDEGDDDGAGEYRTRFHAATAAAR